MKVLVFLVALIFTLVLLYRYAFELYLFFSDRAKFEVVRKGHKMSHGEDGSIEVSVRDRLMISYPLFILGFGLLTIFAGIAAMA